MTEPVLFYYICQSLFWVCFILTAGYFAVVDCVADRDWDEYVKELKIISVVWIVVIIIGFSFYAYDAQKYIKYQKSNVDSVEQVIPE